jgi:hypothetical protein
MRHVPRATRRRVRRPRAAARDRADEEARDAELALARRGQRWTAEEDAALRDVVGGQAVLDAAGWDRVALAVVRRIGSRWLRDGRRCRLRWEAGVQREPPPAVEEPPDGE